MLEELFAGAIADAKAREETISISEIEKHALNAPKATPFLDDWKESHLVKVIAEIKRASPSKGHLADIEDPALLAETYEESGAAAISVLTEGRKFLGSLADFDSVRQQVKVPLLRKDFIATEYQVLEARAHGADIVLLIVAGLEASALKRLKTLIEQLGMTAFVETHSAEEIAIANDLGSRFTGVNARDLSTFDTNRDLFEELASKVDSEAIKVAESAVRNLEDVKKYTQSGADAVLVGEALVRGDANALLAEFTQIQRA